MRICFISTGNFAHIGPYLDYFLDAGHDVRFVALSPSPPRRVPVYDVSLGGAYSNTRGKWKYPLSMLRARAVVRRLAPDVVHTHYATSGGLAGLVCGFRPTVVTAHGTDLALGARSRVWRPLLKAVFDQAACVNAVSEELEALAVGLGVSPEKVSVLTLGVDTARFAFRAPRPLEPGGELRLLCTRHLRPVSDHATLLRAAALARDAGLRFRLTLAGEGPLRDALRRQAGGLGLESRVDFLGAVAPAAMPALLSRHDVYLSPTLRDGTSLSLLEAMSVGLLPVVSRIPANTAWIEPEAGGLLHEPGDAAGLAACLQRLARRPGWAALAALNRRRVEERGDRLSSMRRLEGLYRELAGGGSTRRSQISRQ